MDNPGKRNMMRPCCWLSNPRHANTALLVRLFGLSSLETGEPSTLAPSPFAHPIYLKYLNIHFYERVHRAGHEISFSSGERNPNNHFSYLLLATHELK